MSGDRDEPVPPTTASTSPTAANRPDPMLPDRSPDRAASDGDGHHPALPALALGALGVVYGDIGTSPLYTMRESFSHGGGKMAPTPEMVLGVLSLVFWSLVLTVTIKYVMLILRADNKGEGGVLSLTTLAMHALPTDARRRRGTVLFLAIVGLALFFGDGLITPAISVLSAVEGVQAAYPAFKPWVVPTAVFILALLFLIQARGTGRVGFLFGPVMVLWFLTLGGLGIYSVVQTPEVLAAIDPRYAINIVDKLNWGIFLILGSVVLAVTGGEALYADMGHFGRKPIRVAWFGLVLPGLLLNYFGQGAMLIRNPEALEHIFYELAPDWALLPLIGLSTLATIIASQAVISGVFSLTQQAIQLGFLPRMTVLHTSETEKGQIYVPRVNWILMTGVIALVIGFGSSSDLAGAYGIAVTGAMAIDAILAAIVASILWRWGPVLAGVVFGMLLCIDLAFFAATALKIPDGGWFPLTIAVFAVYVITTWRRGRAIIYETLHADALPLDMFLQRMEKAPLRVAGTAVFMTGDIRVVPLALLHNLKHNKVLHERIIMLQVLTEDVPRVSEARRIEVERLGKGFHTVTARYGYMEQPDVPAIMTRCRAHGLPYDEMQTSFFLGRETLVPAIRSRLGRWRQTVFITMSATALATKVFFRIPPNRAIELGGQVEI